MYRKRIKAKSADKYAQIRAEFDKAAEAFNEGDRKLVIIKTF
ncbi:MAG: hypothetical protein QXZ47_04870 [Candidatus Bathyarchaeia archaeon]